MRYPQGHKQQTSEKILRSAGRLFRKNGYAATGVDAVMASVDMTAGGFYSHFGSKEELLAATLDEIFTDASRSRPARLSELQGGPWLHAFASFYLSSEHRDAPEAGCPMPALAAEVARIGGKPRGVFEQHLRRIVEFIAQHCGERRQRRERAITLMAQCVGGLILARAVKDPSFSEEILRACRDSINRQIDSSPGNAR